MIDVPSVAIGALTASSAISVYMYVRIAAMRAEVRQIRADARAEIGRLYVAHAQIAANIARRGPTAMEYQFAADLLAAENMFNDDTPPPS